MRLWPLFLLLFVTKPSWSHEVRPAYLEINETGNDVFEVLWKLPMRGDMQLALVPGFSVSTRNLTPVISDARDGAVVQRWQLQAEEPLRGHRIHIDGLENTMTDVLVRMVFLDGTQWVKRLIPAEPQATVPLIPGDWDVVAEYFMLGLEHILLGIDHLLFVLALLLITHGVWELVKTVTAFTVAHSITLAAATLGIVKIPVAPVEAVIALSIVFVASEIVRARRGQVDLAMRAPWIVAFLFGLLHGFGFAGALSEIGLPQGNIPLALLLFNLGVEAGQLIFIAVVLGLVATGRLLKVSYVERVSVIPAYLIGSVAMFWVIQRVIAF